MPSRRGVGGGPRLPGLAGGEAKQRTVELIEAHVGPMRERYAALMSRPDEIEAILQAGATKARAVATPFLKELRQAVGLRPFAAIVQKQAAQAQAKSALPVFKQYREADNRFYFKLSAADGSVLLQSQGFAEGREAGAWVKRLKTEGAAALADAPVALAEGAALLGQSPGLAVVELANAPARFRATGPLRIALTGAAFRATLRERGLRLLYDDARRGTSNSRVNFIHPKDAGGVLVELVEPSAEGH